MTKDNGKYDYTYAERQKRMRERKKASGFKEVREQVPADLVAALKAIAAEMRDPVTSDEYRKRFPVSENPSETETGPDADDPSN